MANTPRPNFFVVGSMKSGTTSLHAALCTHPEIFMTTNPKEPTYFLQREQLLDVLPGCEKLGFWRGEEYYLKLFEDAGGYPIIGEASANYARLNRVKGVPERLARFDPGARIVFILRDPLERTVSHYWYMVRFFKEHRDMLAAVHDDPDYTDTSYYAMQIRPYLALFGRERVKVLTMETLRDSPKVVLSDLFEWLGVDADFVPPNLHERSNVAPSVVSQVRGRGLLDKLRYSRLWDSVGPMVPARVRTLARRFSEHEVARDAVDPSETQGFLRPLQRDQTQELMELLGRDFSEWTTLNKEF